MLLVSHLPAGLAKRARGVAWIDRNPWFPLHSEARYLCAEQMWGGSGINRDFCDVRVNRMAEGATEPHNAIASRLVLGHDLAAALTGD